MLENLLTHVTHQTGAGSWELHWIDIDGRTRESAAAFEYTHCQDTGGCSRSSRVDQLKRCSLNYPSSRVRGIEQREDPKDRELSSVFRLSKDL